MFRQCMRHLYSRTHLQRPAIVALVREADLPQIQRGQERPTEALEAAADGAAAHGHARRRGRRDAQAEAQARQRRHRRQRAQQGAGRGCVAESAMQA